MTTTLDQMHSALTQSDAGNKTFLELWLQQLPPERAATLHDWMMNGVRLGVHFVRGTPPTVEVTATDIRGGLVVLDRLDFTTTNVRMH